MRSLVSSFMKSNNIYNITLCGYSYKYIKKQMKTEKYLQTANKFGNNRQRQYNLKKNHQSFEIFIGERVLQEV